MNKLIQEEALTDAYLLGKYDGMKQGRADAIEKAIEFFSEHAHEVYDHVSARDFICDNLEMLKEQT